MADPHDPYLLERIRRAITEDPRVGEPAVRVLGAAGRIWLEGTVTSEERRRAAAEVVAELAPEVEVRNQLEVIVLTGPSEERLER